MPYPLANRLSSTLFSALLALTVNTQADQDPAMEIIIDDGSSSGESIEGADIVIEGGDAAQGAAYYNTLCAQCHGRDGKQPKSMKPFAKHMGNPWEVMHKLLNGQPGEEMPALRALDRQVIVDVMAHLATLPE